MIRRPTRAGRLNATEPQFSQIEGRNEGVDHANRIVICNPVIQAFRQQSRLPAISPFNEACHAQPPPVQYGNHSRHSVFTQPGSLAAVALRRMDGPVKGQMLTSMIKRPPTEAVLLEKCTIGV